jgi:hypothetical protein
LRGYFNGKRSVQCGIEHERGDETAHCPRPKQTILREIGSKWGKFSERELPTLKDRDDLVTQVVAKYGLEKSQAQRDFDALMKGRQI